MRKFYLLDETNTYTGQQEFLFDNDPVNPKAVAVAPPELKEGEVAVWAGTWIIKTHKPSQTSNVSRASAKLTRLAFRNRFTFAEKVAIETAAETDAALRVLLKDQSEATYIDLTRADTQQGVQLLVSKGLLTAERASEILSLNVQSDEEFRG